MRPDWYGKALAAAMKILLVSSEIAPFAKTGGLADVAGSLPRALRRLGHDVRLAMPYYTTVAAGWGEQSREVAQLQLPHGGPVAVRRYDHDGIPVYFVDAPAYFDRPGLYGDAAGDYPDNAERFACFCRAALAALPALDFHPEVIHLNDWQSALIPVLLKTELRRDPFYAPIATLLTIHNLGYQGLFPPESLVPLGLGPELFSADALEYFGRLSFLKGGLLFADLISTVSPSYCREIQTFELGHGLDGLLRQRATRLHGVLNGLDPELWNPATPGILAHPYSGPDLVAKGHNKAQLQEHLGLAVDPDAALVAMVTRIDPQKGIDLVEAAWDGLLQRPLQFVLLGTGEAGLTQRMLARARRDPQRVSVSPSFDETLARQIYAAADLFLMPSRYEPCGLGQLIALRFGAVPLVRHTGGLIDTIVDPSEDARRANGFSFAAASAAALLATLDRALAARARPQVWKALVQRGMQQDFSWERSARRYLELYRLASEDRHD